MKKIISTTETRRRARIRSKVSGDAKCPRLSVFRSNQHIFLQLIDDVAGKTLVSASDLPEKGKKGAAKTKITKSERSKEAGKKLAEAALAKNIKVVAFDRGNHQYHGRIKAAAEGAREGGLKF